MSDKNNFKKLVGSKLQVWRGVAHHTKSGQTKKDLMKNRRNKIVSIKQHEAGKKTFQRNNLKPLTAEQMAELRARKK